MLAHKYTNAPDYLKPISNTVMLQSPDQGIKEFITRTVETSAGFYFYFPDSDLMFARLIAFVASERRKHPALVFGIQLQEDIILLEITGPIGSKEQIIDVIEL
jgi:hypothetical protein